MTDAQPGSSLSWADRFRGAMLGGAVGDALGSGVRNATTAEIQQWFGPQGVVDYLPVYGRRGAVTDLTQLTVFTLEALLRAKAVGEQSAVPTIEGNHLAWLHTQGVPWTYAMSKYAASDPTGWLLQRPELYSTRNPGGPALFGLGDLVHRPAFPNTYQSSSEPPIHQGLSDCIVWTAPLALWSPDLKVVDLDARTTAALLTKDSGAVTATELHADVLAQLLLGYSLWGAVEAWQTHRAFAGSASPHGALRAAHAAMFATNGGRRPSPTQLDIEFDTRTGPGDLGIALAAVAASHNFIDAVIMAVNHSGDSAVTGALAGQLAGAIYGLDGIPTPWLDELELREIIEILCQDATEAFAPPPPPQWVQRYAPNPRQLGGPRELPNTVEGFAEQTMVLPAITAGPVPASDGLDTVDTPPQGIPAPSGDARGNRAQRDGSWSDAGSNRSAGNIGGPTFPAVSAGSRAEPVAFEFTDPSSTGPIPVSQLRSAEAPLESNAVFPTVDAWVDPVARERAQSEADSQFGAFPSLAAPVAPQAAEFSTSAEEVPAPDWESAPAAVTPDESPVEDWSAPVAEREQTAPTLDASERELPQAVPSAADPEPLVPEPAVEPEASAEEAPIVVPDADDISAAPEPAAASGRSVASLEFAELELPDADAADAVAEGAVVGPATFIEPPESIRGESFPDAFEDDARGQEQEVGGVQQGSSPVERAGSEADPDVEREPVDLEPPEPIELESAELGVKPDEDVVAAADAGEPKVAAAVADSETQGRAAEPPKPDSADLPEVAETSREAAAETVLPDVDDLGAGGPSDVDEREPSNGEPRGAAETPAAGPKPPEPAVPPIARGEHAKADRPDDSAPSLTERVLGCFLGGALGDALGADLEFITASEIAERFGPDGPSGLREAYGVHGAITDDTQMTLFTAEGLIRGSVANRMLGTAEPLAEVQLAYQRWLHTQGVEWDAAAGPFLADYPAPDGWLVEVPGLFKTRAPGKTVFRALARFGDGHPAGSFTERINDSKGCGGVMRAAPVALCSTDPAEVFRLAASTAALTHSHPAGYHSAGALAVIVQQALLGRGLDDGVWLALQVLETWEDHEETSAMLKAAVDLAEAGVPSPQQVAETLGGGWVGEEALAIAVCAALVGGEDVELALRIAVHHDGDSDSTGAICGNIVGALLGVGALPVDWLAELELRDVVEQMALDCVAEFGRGAFQPGRSALEPPTDEDWNERYPVRPQWSAAPEPARRAAGDEPGPEFPAPKPAPRRINGVVHTFEGEAK